MQRLCSGTAGCLLVRPEIMILTLTTRIALLYGCHPSPPQSSPLLIFFIKIQALKKNTKNMNKCAQMTPKCHQKVCKNDTFSRVTPNMTNCVLTAQAAADGGSSDPENHEKEQKKDLRANTLQALVFVWKNYKKNAKTGPLK